MRVMALAPGVRLGPYEMIAQIGVSLLADETTYLDQHWLSPLALGSAGW